MKTTIEKTIKHSLILDESDVTSLFSFLTAQYPHVDIFFVCNDGSEITTNVIDDVVNFENANFRRIESLSMVADSGKSYGSEYARLRIRGTWRGDQSATVSVKSETDSKAIYISQEIPKLLSGMKAGYDIFARLSLITLVGTAFILWGLFRWLSLMLGLRKPMLNAPTDFSAVEIFNIVAWSFLVFALIVVGLEFVRMRLFPLVFFLIGKQRKKMEALNKWRWGVLATMLFGIVSSLIAGYLQRAK